MPCPFFRMRWNDRWDKFRILLKAFHDTPFNSADKKNIQALSRLIDSVETQVKELQQILKRAEADLLRLNSQAATRFLYDGWEKKVAQMILDMRVALAESTKDAQYADIFKTERDAFWNKLIEDEDSYLADLRIICVAAAGPKVEPVLYFVSEFWPTMGDDDRGYQQAYHQGRPYSAAKMIDNIVRQYLANNPTVIDGPLNIPSQGKVHPYPLSSLQGHEAGATSRMIFKALKRTVNGSAGPVSQLLIYYCFFVTDAMHNADYGRSACVNVYSRLYKPSCGARILSWQFFETSKWTQIPGPEFFKP